MLKSILKFYSTDKFFPISWLFSGFKMDRKWDYTCYLLFKILLTMSAFLSVFLAVDGYFQLDILIPVIPFYFDKTIFYEVFRNIMAPVSGILICFFYLKIRLSIKDMKVEKIPYMEKRDFYGEASKVACLWNSFALIMLSLFAILMLHLIPLYINQYFHFQENYWATVIIQAVPVIITPLFAAYLVDFVLLFEKTLVGFFDMQSSIREMEKVSVEDW